MVPQVNAPLLNVAIDNLLNVAFNSLDKAWQVMQICALTVN